MWRTLRQTGHGDRFGERLGSSPYLPRNEIIWIHGASVGEIRAAVPLVQSLHRAFPQHPLLVTSFTGAGRAQAQALFGDRVLVALLPYDLPFCVNRWLKCTSPVIGIIMETEIWPNLFAACARRRMPLILVSARLSERAMRRYERFRRLVRQTLGHVTAVSAQTGRDAENFRRLGLPPERLAATGNLKFDLPITDALVAQGRELRQRLFGQACVVVAGSTRQDEEGTVLAAFSALVQKQPASALVLAPRHPERAGAVAEIIRSAGFRCLLRSAGNAPVQAGEVLLLDTLGELMSFYAAGDMAFVGGSLVQAGGHNLLEPAALGLPVLAGPQLANVLDVAELLKDAGGLIVVADAKALGEAFVWLAAQPATRRHIGQAAQQTVTANRGALERIVALVGQQIAGRAVRQRPITGGARH